MPRPKKEKPTRADGIYEVKITLGRTVQGKLIRKSFYSSVSKADAWAKAEEYKIKHEAANRTGVFDYNETMTFEKWAHKWLEVYKKPNVSESTYNTTYRIPVENHLIPYFKEAKLTSIKSVDVQEFFKSVQNDCSGSKLHKLKICLNRIFETAIDNEICYKNPAKNISYTSGKLQNEKKVYTNSQIDVVKKYFETRLPEVCIMLETGLRRGEVLGLMWKDIDFDKHTLSVNRSIADKQNGGIEVRPPKWNSYRTIPITSELCSLLVSLDKQNDYIFTTTDGNIQSPHTWSRKLERHMAAMHKQCPDIPTLTAHELRHTRGTQLRRDGVDIYTIQKLMGHKDINVTANTYVHEEIEVTRRAAKIF